MIRITCVLLALMLILPATAARSADNPLIGTWKLKSYVREVAATGERTTNAASIRTAILATRPTAACMRSSPGKIA